MKNLGAPKFFAGAPKKKELGAPVQPVQKVSLEPWTIFIDIGSSLTGNDTKWQIKCPHN